MTSPISFFPLPSLLDHFREKLSFLTLHTPTFLPCTRSPAYAVQLAQPFQWVPCLRQPSRSPDGRPIVPLSCCPSHSNLCKTLLPRSARPHALVSLPSSPSFVVRLVPRKRLSGHTFLFPLSTEGSSLALPLRVPCASAPRSVSFPLPLHPRPPSCVVAICRGSQPLLHFLLSLFLLLSLCSPRVVARPDLLPRYPFLLLHGVVPPCLPVPLTVHLAFLAVLLPSPLFLLC